MADSFKLVDATTASVAASGTSVAPTQTLFDNTHTMVILNPDSTNTVLFDYGTPGGALDPATSVNILPKTSVSIACGTLGQRPTIGDDMRFDTTAGAIDVRIFYVNGV